MLYQKTLLVVVLVVAATAFGAGFGLAQYLRAGEAMFPTQAQRQGDGAAFEPPAPAQLQVKEPTFKDPKQVPADAGTAASPSPGRPQAKEPTVDGPDQVLAEPGAPASPAPVQPQVSVSTSVTPEPAQPQVSVSTSVTPEPAQPQVNVSTTEAPTPAQPQVDGSTIKTRDELLVEAGAAVPGFGGFLTQMKSVDLAEIRFQCGDPTLKKREDNILVSVYMVDTTQQAEARRALEIIMGAEYVARRVREVRTEQGQYSISQLSQWYELIKPLVSADGVWRIDLAERINRIRVDVGVHEASHQVEAELDRLGVPREAVEIEISDGTWVFDKLD